MNTNAKWILGTVAVVAAYGVGTGADSGTVQSVPTLPASAEVAPPAELDMPVTGAAIVAEALAYGEGPALAQGTELEGRCRVFVGNRTVFSCVPAESPDGAPVLRVEEDSSARYADGWTIDAETDEFYRS
jgi:hypothetical protein